jgi:outer membrane protein OmpA-like peptidoglycan-associated protein
MVAGMLSAIQDFARDSFATGQDAALEEFRIGDLQVWIAAGRYAYLAAVIRGNPPRELRTSLEETIESVHILKGSALAFFEGDAAEFNSLRPELEECLRTQYSVSKSSGGRQVRAWAALGGLAAIGLLALALAVRSQAHWRDFLRRLNAEPGIVVTEARKGWISPSQVNGLRDRSAADPAGIAQAAKVDPARVRFHWTDFLALDPSSVLKRFADRFGIPTGTQTTMKDGVLTLSGSVPYEWLEGVRREATLVPGVVSLADREAKVIYHPDFVLKRFKEKFGLPEAVKAVLSQGVLTLSGEAFHGWLTRVRSEATSVPGVIALEENNVIDLDQRAFQQSKSVIENAFVYFLSDKDDIATEGFAALSRLPAEINRCENSARQLGLNMTLEIHGSADAVGNEEKNVDLSQRRANKVRDFLVSCGFESTGLQPIGRGGQRKSGESEKAPEQSDRRVSFKVVTQPKTPSP